MIRHEGYADRRLNPGPLALAALVVPSLADFPELTAGADPSPDLDAPGQEPLSLEELIRLTWPDDAATALAVAGCESDVGRHSDTYDLSKANAGPFQLNRDTWEPFFAAKYGWTWAQVVTEPETHLRAAREVYDRSSGWSPWRCWSPP